MKAKMLIVFLIIIGMLIALVGRLAYIELKSGDKYGKIVLNQQEYSSKTIPFRRGDIVDRKGTVLATSTDVYNVILDCSVLTSKEDYMEPTLSALAQCFELNTDDIRTYVKANPKKRYYVLAKKLPYEEIAEFESLQNDKKTGKNIKGLDLVLNYDLPDVPETYVHRIGRTGRAGCEGRAIAFCSGEEVPMLREIEKLTGIKLEQRKHDLPPLEETKAAPVVNVARKVQAKAPADKQQGKQNNKRREGRKPAEPLKNTQQATVVAEKSKRHNRPAKPKLVREPQQKQSADKTEQASSRSAKLRSRYENYE